MEKTINSMRFLGLDMINKARSGHPGIVLGAAPIMYALFQKHLNQSIKDPFWFNRDRFVLSAGHGSALLYATLHLAGFALSIEDLKAFRQRHSKTPGHPEYLDTPGVDATTGPLGQGISMAVGMAIAELYLSNMFNLDNFEIVNHYTYVLCGDGDLQEGISQEALSLAGHLKLNKLIILFDSNQIQLDGPTNNAFSEDTRKRYESIGFNYQYVDDANDVELVSQAIEKAKLSEKPSFIEIRSIIGYGTSKAGQSSAHGSPIGEDETTKLKARWQYEHLEFEVDPLVYADFSANFAARGIKNYNTWLSKLNAYRDLNYDGWQAINQIIESKVDLDFSNLIAKDIIGYKEATRDSAGKFLNLLQEKLLFLIGGSADLASSTKIKGINGNFSLDNLKGRNICFGVREHAMGAIINGMTLHGLRAFAGGFMVFSDYLRPAIRMAAMMKIPSLFFFSHDSVAVGEDGPTHQPIEQLSSLRLIPNLNTFRPANVQETKYAIRYALEMANQPTAIILSRQNVTFLHESKYEDFIKGAYIASDYQDFTGIIIATGYEVELALKAKDILFHKHKIKVRVISMPSMEIFNNQPKAYQESLIPSHIKSVLAVEAGSSGLWYRYTKDILGIDSFGLSGKQEDVLSHFGFTPEGVVARYLLIS